MEYALLIQWLRASDVTGPGFEIQLEYSEIKTELPAKLMEGSLNILCEKIET